MRKRTWREGYVPGKAKKTIHIDDEVARVLEIRAAQERVSQAEIVERALRRELGMERLSLGRDEFAARMQGMSEIKPVTATIHSDGDFHEITLCIREGEVIVSGGIDQDALWSAAIEETGGYADAEAGFPVNPTLAEETYREGIQEILDGVVGALLAADIVEDIGEGELEERDYESYCEYTLPLKDNRLLRLRAHYYDGNFDAEIEEED